MITIYIATLPNLLWNIVNIAVKRVEEQSAEHKHINRNAVVVCVAPFAAKRLASEAR